MPTHAPSASLLPAALVTLLLLVPATLAEPMATATLRSVGEFLLDAEGRALGENVAGRLGAAEAVVEGFSALALGAHVFESIRIPGFELREQVTGAGSPALTMRGTNAIVTLHDNIHSMVQVRALEPITVVHRLGPDVVATTEGTAGAVVALHTRAGAGIGHLVAYGAEGPRALGERLEVGAGEVVARLQSGSDLVFVARHAQQPSLEYEGALVQALAAGAVVSHYVTEFEGSLVAASQVDATGALAQTRADASGFVETTLTAREDLPNIVLFDLAYETLPAHDAEDVVVFVDGERAERVEDARDVLPYAKFGLPRYHALSGGGRTQVVASSPLGGEHRIVVSVAAEAHTEPQARAQSGRDGGARVYGGIEHHANGKLTGEFLTGILPEDRARLLGFTSLATRTEVFRSVVVDGGAEATFHASGAQTMVLDTAKATLALVDDAHATMTLTARSAVDATYELATGVRASPLADDILLLDGPHGAAGALVLVGDGGRLALDGERSVRAHLDAGATLVYRGAPDAHASEPALLRALADGRLGAQVLAGVHDGALVARATSYAHGAHAQARALEGGAIEVAYSAGHDAPRAFALDARGAALAAKGAADVRVSIDGVALAPAATLEEVLDASGASAYHASTSAEGALRVVVRVGSASARVLVESVAQEAAEARARSDAFGSFRVFHDGSAVGSYVTLRADRAAGALSGLTDVATGTELVATLVAGRSPYVALGLDGDTVLRFENGEARVEVSDTTNAFTRVVALADTDAAFALAAGLRAEARAAGVVDVVDEAGAHVASLVVTSGSLAVRSERDVRASLSRGGELLFRTHAGIESELSAAQRAMINKAIAAGRVAGQVVVRAEGDAARAFTAAYGDVEAVTVASRERVEVTLDSASEHGKTLLVSLDPRTIPGMARGHALIRFDGELAAQASSYADILDASDDGGVAEYFVLAGDAGTQVLVSIPSFSVHTVTLEQQERRHEPLFMYATIILGLLVLVESVLLARGARRNRNVNTRRP